MARIQGKKVSWTPSVSPDVVAHNLRACLETDTMDYSLAPVRIDLPLSEYDLPGAFSMPEDTNYKLGLSSIDDVGNESDISEVVVPLDFIAPDAPTNILVLDI